MTTVWISTHLCNHAVCLVPRIAGGCLAPEAKANTWSTGRQINPGLHKNAGTFELCSSSLPIKTLNFDRKVFPTSLPVRNASPFLCSCTQQLSSFSFKYDYQTTSDSSWHIHACKLSALSTKCFARVVKNNVDIPILDCMCL